MLLLPVFLILMAAVVVKSLVTDTGFAGINRLAGMFDCFSVTGNRVCCFCFMQCQNIFFIL